MSAETIVNAIASGAGSIINMYPQVQQTVEKTTKTVITALDKVSDLLIEEIKKNDEERKRAAIALSKYVSPAYDEGELLELFQTAREDNRDYIIIRDDEIKAKTIERMNADKKMKYRFTKPTKREVREVRPDLLSTCCLFPTTNINLESLIKISFSLI